jgi:ribosomal protein L32
MKSTPLKVNQNAPMRVVNNRKSKSKKSKKQLSKIYINTLMPKFNYKNNEGENITPHNCAML